MELAKLKEGLEELKSENRQYAVIGVDTVLNLIAEVEKLQGTGVDGYVLGLKMARGLCQSRATQWRSVYESGWRGTDETIGQRLLAERYLEVTAVMDELQSRIDVNDAAKNPCEKHLNVTADHCPEHAPTANGRE
jgi:hypothetical protein